MKREILIKKDKFTCNMCIRELIDIIEMWMKTIGTGNWVLKLEKKTQQRGVSQNALLWVWMDALSKEWADATDNHYTKEQFKEYFTHMFLPVSGPNGTVVGGSTSMLTTEQMTEFMNKIQAYAATEWGITLLNQEDKMFNEWRAQYE